MDYILNLMKKFNVPVTRDNYSGLAYPEGLPKDWNAELESHLPKSLQKKSILFAKSADAMRHELTQRQ